MFFLSNTYQLKDTKTDIFDTHFDTETSISHFTSIDGYHVFSTRNELYSLKNKKQKKIAGFKADITSLSVHQRLICAGTLNGEVGIFSEHRTAIRQFKAHNAEITDIIIAENEKVISSAKDHMISIHSLTDDKLIKKIHLEKDIPIKILTSADKLYVFSKRILIYSLNDFELIKVIEFGALIENAIIVSEDKILFTSKNSAYFIDLNELLVSSGYLLHTRDITSIQTHGANIYSCSIDGHFKSFNEQLKNINDFNLGCKLISFSIIDSVPFIVSADGKIYSLEIEKSIKEQRKNMRKPKEYEDDIDYEVIQSSKKMLTETDKLLSNYMYKEAIRRCFGNNNLAQYYNVLKYISDKRGFMKLVRDADVDFIKNILQMCLEVIKIDEFTPMVVEILMIITSHYINELTEEQELRNLVEHISLELDEVVAFEEAYLKTISFTESFSS
jgi:hypothetical protein